MKAVGRYGGKAVRLTAVVLLTALPPYRPTAQWRPEERVLLTDFSHVDAIAASPFTVFVASRRGLVTYDRRFDRWGLPVTFLEGYPGARVRVALADPVNDGVWLGTEDGWARYDPMTRAFERGPAVGGVRSLMLDTRDAASGVYLLDAAGWAFLPRGAVIPTRGRPLPPPDQRVEALDVRVALDQAPIADAMRAAILSDARFRVHQFTAAARSPDGAELFFGTNGMGVVRLDPTTGQWQSLAFGLIAPKANAVAPGSGGVWVAAADRAGRPSGITWVAADLSRTSAAESTTGTAGTGLQFLEARDLIASGAALWVATDRGLYRVEPASLRASFVEVPDAVYSLAPAPDGIWAGTARGLARVTADGRVSRFGVTPVLSLAVVHDTLWIGTAVGVGFVAPDATSIVVPDELSSAPSLRAPIVALERAGETVVAATVDQLAWRNPKTRTWTVSRPPGAIGRITALVADGDGLWIGGTAGLAFWQPVPSRVVTLGVPGDVPAPVRDLARDGTYLWVATDSGLVRFERTAVLRR